MSVFVDLDRSKGIFATSTRERKVIGEFQADLEAHGGEGVNMVNFSADLWKPYRDGIAEHFQNADLTLDRYHLIQLLKTRRR